MTLVVTIASGVISVTRRAVGPGSDEGGGMCDSGYTEDEGNEDGGKMHVSRVVYGFGYGGEVVLRLLCFLWYTRECEGFATMA